ncbi:MAG: dihydropteroate synthase [Myxococcota bacterium]
MMPELMGVLNVTPDSFSDGGRFVIPRVAVDHGLRMLDEGATVLDVGGESTRPGSEAVTEAAEIARVRPVIEGVLKARPNAQVSIDTQKAEVARVAIESGACIVNDVSAGRDPHMLSLVAKTGVRYVLMHMRGVPKTMQRDTNYDDLIGDIAASLGEAADRARASGIGAERIVVDPGVGFGKAAADNPKIIASVPRFKALGYPVLIGASRKSFIGRLTEQPNAAARMAGSVGAALAAVDSGADWLRVHDVRETHDALTVYLACKSPAS